MGAAESYLGIMLRPSPTVAAFEHWVSLSLSLSLSLILQCAYMHALSYVCMCASNMCIWSRYLTFFHRDEFHACSLLPCEGALYTPIVPNNISCIRVCY